LLYVRKKKLLKKSLLILCSYFIDSPTKNYILAHLLFLRVAPSRRLEEYQFHSTCCQIFLLAPAVVTIINPFLMLVEKIKLRFGGVEER